MLELTALGDHLDGGGQGEKAVLKINLRLQNIVDRGDTGEQDHSRKEQDEN